MLLGNKYDEEMKLNIGLLLAITGLPLISFAESDDARITKLEEEVKKLQDANDQMQKKLNERPVPIIRRREVSAQNIQQPVKEVEPTERVAEFGGHIYKFIPTRKSWNKAKLEAEKMGGYLVCIDSDKEQSFISELVSINGKVRPTWIGLTDEEVEGEWKWVNGAKAGYVNWQPNQPDNGDFWGAKQNCAWLGWCNSTQWDDMWEFATLYSVVEFDKPVSPQATK